VPPRSAKPAAPACSRNDAQSCPILPDGRTPSDNRLHN
jgi:hypothetical protein